MDLIENVGRRSRVGGDNGDFINVGVFSLNGYERNALYENMGDLQFSNVAYERGCDRVEDGRGLAIFDFDRDGDLDLVMNNYKGAATLLVNHAAPETHWIEVRLTGQASNRGAIGARVTIEHDGKRQVREVISAAGYLSGQTLDLHFGLGPSEFVDVLRIDWPSGLKQEFKDVPSNKFYRIVEGADPSVARL